MPGDEVTLLERRQRLGGLTWSFRRNGLSFDNGQHVFLRCCAAYRGSSTASVRGDAVYLQPRLDIPVLSPKGTRASHRRGSLRAPAPPCARPWPATGTSGSVTGCGWPGRPWP